MVQQPEYNTRGEKVFYKVEMQPYLNIGQGKQAMEMARVKKKRKS